MEFFGLVDAIRSYCASDDRTTPIHFHYGANAFANIEADLHTYVDNDLILIADFNATPTFDGGRVTRCRYSGVLSLGRKRESETVGQVTTHTESSIDETPIQKYDRRLKDLTTLLGTIIGDLSCENELDIISCNMRFDLNQFDLSADFTAAQITFEQ
jgi:hypothetical protein